ncbi:hypothetical protein OROHE_001079 [Orobanche hederae]
MAMELEAPSAQSVVASQIDFPTSRKHIKRRRFHMSEQDNMTEQDTVRWYEHRDAYVTLLESVCVGTDISMGCTFSDKFWWQFTRRLIRECRLDIAVTETTVNSCQKFGEFLKRMHKDFEWQVTSSTRTLMEVQPPELKQKLFNIFGQRTPSFQGLSGGRSSDASLVDGVKCRGLARNRSLVRCRPTTDLRRRPLRWVGVKCSARRSPLAGRRSTELYKRHSKENL